MDLGAFLADDSLGGSWADEDVDMSSIGVQVASNTASSFSVRREEYNQSYSNFEDRPRRDREEFPVPDAPPYRARVGNLPYDVDESSLARFFEDRLQAPGSIEEVKVPVDNLSGKPKGFAFVTFHERAQLEESLNLTLSEFQGRKVFVNVAAPQKADVFDMDWRAARGSGMRPSRAEAESEWGRGGNRDRPERRVREEPDLDWGSARAAPVPQRERSNRSFDRPIERRPQREEPDLDWGSARTTQATLAPRERSNRTLDRPIERRPKRDEPDLDWNAARTTVASLPPRERFNRVQRPKKDEPELDWKRGQPLESVQRPHKSQQKPKEEKKEKLGPQKSLYDVLAVEGDSDEEAAAPQPVEKKQEDPVEELQSSTAQLSVEETKDDGEWEVVRK